jgi:hypothetical protein
VGQHQVRDVYLDVEASYYVCHSLHTIHRAQIFNQNTISIIPTGIATNNDCPVATKVLLGNAQKRRTRKLKLVTLHGLVTVAGMYCI